MKQSLFVSQAKRVFSYEITETMIMSQTDPLEIKLFS